MRQHIDLNRGWEFTEHFEDFSDPVTVSLPHTCRETPYDYFDESAYQMVCGYRRRIAAPEDVEAAAISPAQARLIPTYVPGRAAGA